MGYKNIGCVAACFALVVAPAAHGAAFALIEQNASGLGNAFAGSAARANDASILFFNPAGLSELHSPQVTVGADAIDLTARFQDSGSRLPPAGLGALPTGATRTDGGCFDAVPDLYLAAPAGNRLTLGLGVGVPFGLRTEYVDPWVGRFQGLKSKLLNLNINPAVAYRVNDWLAVGGGADYQKANASLSNAVLLGPRLEGRARLDLNDWAWGWNVGALFSLPTETRIGVSYRSRINFNLTGNTAVTTLAGTVIPGAGGASAAALTMPDSAIVSVAQRLSPAWELLADVSWTQWSRIQAIKPLNPATGVPRDQLNFAFKDTWRAAVGANYRWTDAVTLRSGLAWDQTPVRDEARTVRLPDGDRKWISAGIQWSPSGEISIDAAYAHLFVSSPGVNLTRPQLGAPASFSSTVTGSYDAAVNIYGVQLTYRFL